MNDANVDGFMRARNTSGSQLSAVIGDPRSSIESIERFRKVGVDELIFVMQTGTQPHELIMESIKTMAEDVFPHFK